MARNGQGVHMRPDRGAHLGNVGAGTWQDDGTRLMRSVIRAKNMHRSALHPTEKPAAILLPLIAFACNRGGSC